ncbi:MAG: hypothetical protein KF800_12070 [Lysobacter sp.]|nr:hypothetical protein [Lysobacter sp.]
MMRGSPAALAEWLALLACLCVPVTWAASVDASRTIACDASRRDMRAYASRETPADIAKAVVAPDEVATWCRQVRGDARAEVCLSGPVGDGDPARATGCGTRWMACCAMPGMRMPIP